VLSHYDLDDFSRTAVERASNRNRIVVVDSALAIGARSREVCPQRNDCALAAAAAGADDRAASGPRVMRSARRDRARAAAVAAAALI